MEKYRIALVEDNPVNTKSFLRKIEGLENLHLVFTASNGQEALRHLKGLHLPVLPQVVFMDLEMPQLNGIETIKLAKVLYPQIHFLVMTVFDDDEKIFEAIRSGATGYLLKHEDTETIHQSIVQLLEFGGAPMSPAIARKTLLLLGQKTQQPSTESKQEFPAFLTEREKEVLQHLILGWDAKKIAVVLEVSFLTIRKHIANIYQKLHINSQAQVINLAHQQKWI